MSELLKSKYSNDFPNKTHQEKLSQDQNHQREIHCSICGKLYFLDKDELQRLESLLKYDLETQFLCKKCERQYREITFE